VENKKATILYVEDDESLSFVTKDHLEISGFTVTHCSSGDQALKLFDSAEFDLCLLDIMLPNMDGYAVAEYIRQHDTSIPILFLTAKSLKEDRLKGFRKGGDDYITKPYSIEELVMKIEVFLRRREVFTGAKSAEVSYVGSYKFDPINMLLERDGKQKQLTQKESEVLEYFVNHQNELIPRKDLLIAVWGKDDYFLGRSLDVFISKLRKYMKDDEAITIQNVHGVGFKMIV
jgi:DNA-binding response OmpR family regulator